MIQVTAQIDGAASLAAQDALVKFSKSLGAAAKTAPQRAAIQICKSLRAATKVAKKYKGMTASASGERPQWITYAGGKKLKRPLRRYKATLTDRGMTVTRFVYAGERGEMKKQMRGLVGTNYWPSGSGKTPAKRGGHRGLAKQSWGWVMHNIYNRAAPDAPWARRRRDRRNPKDATRESTSSSFEGLSKSGGYARIVNRLDYILSAISQSAVSDAIGKAANWMLKQVDLRSSGRLRS